MPYIDYEKIKKEGQYLSDQPKKKNKFTHFLKVLFFIILIFFIVSSSFSYKVIFSQESLLSGMKQLPVIKQIRKLVGWDNDLRGYNDDRINFLLLGQGGVGHEGPYLTDTIIFASIKPSTGQVAMFSIPRDFLVQIPGKGWYKINSVNSFGETENYEGGGSALLAEIVSDIFDLEIHYYLRVDFEAFKQIVDKLGDIEVCVDKSFTDELYPTKDFLYQTVSFNKGCQKMDGETALIFARSRHGTNGEGSDFARSRRQQKVILALKNKIFDWRTVFNPNLVYSLFDMTKTNIQTNVKKSEIISFIDLAKKIVDSEIKRRVLDNSPQGLLMAEITEQGAYVLVPRTGDYSELRYLAKNIFSLSEQPASEEEQVKLIVLNGTKVEGLARDVSGLLSSLSYQIIDIDNSPNQEYEKTVIYKMPQDEQKQALKILKESLEANTSDELPEFLNEYKNQEADFIVVLGCNPDEERCQVEQEEENNQ